MRVCRGRDQLARWCRRFNIQLWGMGRKDGRETAQWHLDRYGGVGCTQARWNATRRARAVFAVGQDGLLSA